MCPRKAKTDQKRLPKTRRAKNPPRFIITERDISLVRAVLEYRFVYTKHMLWLQPPNTSRQNIQTRLRLLYHHGYVERVRLEELRGAENLVYSLTEKGAVVYRLTPFDAYRQNLVKRIEVASVVKADDANQAFIRLESVKTLKNTITAKLTAHKLMKDGTVKETSFTLKPDSDLAELTNLPQYTGLTVEEIDVAGHRYC